ncbi:DUF2332 domain-containing protein [Halobacillus aidingensis]|uniref:DUF2332 domain-containing protein n=1 Tax=Halobacillus aidingensis TaxID=240303 RepID=A0A1H0GG82_HALAD|nr:DUF2332 domain-containing protein [Halobacillus aidingensis]SDO05927.1 hypothetical protein SAMN05421677_102316 [Halobacillus aidingensis]
MKTLPIADLFKDFATNECEGSSELYKQLSLHIAEDEKILQLCRHTRESQPVPNLLFGAVHYLLLKGNHHELETFYPSLTKSPDLTQNPFPFFQSFCKENREAIITILETKRVQTNEVRRCAYLYPVFCTIHEQTKKPLSLIEIGTSAGLQLLWDKYSYSYGDHEIYGNPSSLVQLHSKVRRGTLSPEVMKSPPPVEKRIGVDLHVSDLTKEEDVQWLKALIWPEHEERRRNFETAVRQFRTSPPTMMEGDGVALLPRVAEDIPHNSTLCIYHTHVANQMPENVKEDLLQKVEEIGQGRDVFHIYNNIHDRRKLHVDSYLKGSFKTQTIGETDGHGRWFDWELQN